MLATPQPALLGRNGTLVTFPKLHSNVAAFSSFPERKMLRQP